MRHFAAVAAVLITSIIFVRGADLPKPDTGVSKLPVALSNDFEFRKTKLFFMNQTPPPAQSSKFKSLSRGSSAPDASIGFERSYRLFGAVTELDKRQRYGNYFDFFWRGKHEGAVTVRLEYRQEALRSFVQAREVTYPNARGNHKTEFTVIGDDYFDDGRVIAWRCLLIADGRIVAENRSYLWD